MGMAATESQFHVLAVDDSIIDRKLIERLLKTSSYQVTTVDSGSKALQFLGLNHLNSNNPNHTSVSPNNHLQEVEVNLVITDYCMPGMTGYDLLKKMKESSSLRDIPVVIMSSENVPSRISRCLEEGAEEFLLKPVRLSDVNKLKPHMMKTRCKNVENPEKEEQIEVQRLPETSSSSSSSTDKSEKSEIQPKKLESQRLTETSSLSDKSEKSEFQAQKPQSQSTNQSSNKRNAVDVEECLSPERTRLRYTDKTVVSNGLHI